MATLTASTAIPVICGSDFISTQITRIAVASAAQMTQEVKFINDKFIRKIAEDKELTISSGTTLDLITPITVKGSKVIFDTKRMIVGKTYRYIDSSKPYIAVKNKDKSIDIYRVHHR